MKAFHAGFIAVSLAAAPFNASAQKALATGDVNHAGITAEVTECKRSDNTLTVKIRLKNTGDDAAAFYIVTAGKYDNHYVTAGRKKYLMLRDAEKKPLAPASNPIGDVRVTIPMGGAWTWWAKFPAPPAEVKKIEYTWPLGAPIDDIPCSAADA